MCKYSVVFIFFIHFFQGAWKDWKERGLQAVDINANLQFGVLGLDWNLEFELRLVNSWKWCYFCLNLFPNFWLWSEMHWAGLMHSALAPASNSCIRLMHPPLSLSSSHLPGQHATGPLSEAETHQGQGESLFHSSGIISRLQFFTFCSVAKSFFLRWS